MKNKIKLFLVGLFCLLITMPVKADTSRMNDQEWYNWKQIYHEHPWNREFLGLEGGDVDPEGEYKKQPPFTLGSAGCFVYSVSIQAYRSGVKETFDGKNVNPVNVKNAGIKSGGISSPGGGLVHSLIHTAFKDEAFKFVKEYPASVNGVEKAISEGYYPVIQYTRQTSDGFNNHYEPVSHVEEGKIIIYGVSADGGNQFDALTVYANDSLVFDRVIAFKGPNPIQDGLQVGEFHSGTNDNDSDNKSSSKTSGGNSDPFIWQKEVIVDYEENKDDGSRTKGLESANKRSFFEFITGQ